MGGAGEKIADNGQISLDCLGHAGPLIPVAAVEQRQPRAFRSGVVQVFAGQEPLCQWRIRQQSHVFPVVELGQALFHRFGSTG